MTDQDRTNFLGVQVTGEPHDARRNTPQKPVDELAPIMQRVLNDLFFVAFGWVQYTPYFNDGDLCEFGVHTFWIKTREDVVAKTEESVSEIQEKLLGHLRELTTAGVIHEGEWDDLDLNARAAAAARNAVFNTDDDEDEDNYKYEVGYGKHPSLGGMDGWRDDARYVGDHHEKWTIAKELSKAITGGEFENVLLEQFGDHASVTWTRNNTGGEFTIEEYSHD